ncbi:MAG TPA: hypothetical protein VFQ85_07560 [Mycobacteriales bacterium]|jgi:hypothetical protein|nr:hypothetical protein [Mycobacteriales bacterium]
MKIHHVIAVPLVVLGLFAPSADARENRHPCRGPRDSYCYIPGINRDCDFYVEVQGRLVHCGPQSYYFYKGAFVLAGLAEMAPGLGQAATFESVHWTFELAGLASECVFDGGSTGPETLLNGEGSGIVSGCSGASISGTLAYVRQGTAMTVSGTWTVEGVAGPVTGACELAPTSVNPATSYSLECAVVI